MKFPYNDIKMLKLDNMTASRMGERASLVTYALNQKKRSLSYWGLSQFQPKLYNPPVLNWKFIEFESQFVLGPKNYWTSVLDEPEPIFWPKLVRPKK